MIFHSYVAMLLYQRVHTSLTYFLVLHMNNVMLRGVFYILLHTRPSSAMLLVIHDVSKVTPIHVLQPHWWSSHGLENGGYMCVPCLFKAGLTCFYWYTWASHSFTSSRMPTSSLPDFFLQPVPHLIVNLQRRKGPQAVSQFLQGGIIFSHLWMIVPEIFMLHSCR